MLRCSLIRFRIRSPAAKKYFSTPMFACTSIALAAVGQVCAWGPHEVAAEAVDVVRELDVVERVRDPELVLDLRLGGLGGAGENVARARVRRADVSVEDRPERVVAVQIDAPRVPRGRIRVAYGAPVPGLTLGRPEVRRERVVGLLAAHDAVVRQVAPLHVEVVHRVVRAVRVRRRQDEDVEVVDKLSSSADGSRSCAAAAQRSRGR